MKKIKRFLLSIKPNMDNKSDYEGLITVFAIMLTIEYTSDCYDLWDTLFGVFAFYIGYFLYLENDITKKDNFYKLLASSLTSLGILTILYSLLSILGIIPDKNTFIFSSIKLLVFIAIIYYIYKDTDGFCQKINNRLTLK